MTAPDAIDEVLRYAAAGVGVMPLHTWRGGRCTCRRSDCAVLGDGTTVGSPAKHPLTEHGKDDATTDLGVIAEWAARWPGCNWGMRPPVGVVVLDVDPRNGGDEQLAQLEEKNGALPDTLKARTGSGGWHIWLTYNGPTRGKLCTGVDVKTNGGYLVAPPSLHACGGRYEWIDQRPAAYAPEWVKAILNPPVVRRPRLGDARGIDPLIRFVMGGTPGTDRNKRLFWAACRAVEQGADPWGLLDAAVQVGLAEMEASATIRSATRATDTLPPPVRTSAAADFLKGA